MDNGILLAGAAGGDVIFACALIGSLGLGAQWLAWRLQAPAIVLMSLAVLAVGPLWSVLFGNPLLSPQATFGDVFRPIVSLAVAVILFEGGLVLKFENLREALPKESQMFLAWFGGAPGAASALFLISLFDAPSIVEQDAVLTVGALAVLFGVFAARLTSRPLIKSLLKETALAKKRRMFADA